MISTWHKFIQKMWLVQSWCGNRLVKFIFGMTKTWNAPWQQTEYYKIIRWKSVFWFCLYNRMKFSFTIFL